MSQITESPIKELDITAQVNAIQKQLAEMDTSQASMCSYWPMAKTILSVLTGLAGSYPTVVTAINALIAAGNAVCPSSNGTSTEAVLEQLRKEGINDLDDMAAYLVRVSTQQKDSALGAVGGIVYDGFIVSYEN